MPTSEQVIAIRLAVQGLEQAKAALGAVGDATKVMAAKMQNVGNSMNEMGNKMISWGKNTQWVGRQLMYNLTLPIVGLGAASVKSALDFDKSMRQVAAIVGTSASQTNPLFKRMSDAALKIGETTTISSKDAADALYELVSAGMSASDAMNNLNIVSKFAEAAQMSVGDATNYATRAVMAWSDKGYTMTRIMDITSAAVNKSTAHFSDFTKNIEMSQQFAKQAGLSYEDLAQAIMVLSDKGAPLQRIGFNISQMFTQMISPSNKAKNVMNQLSLSYYDLNHKMKPLPQILKEIKEKTKGLNDEKKAEVLNTLFNIRAGRAALSLLSGTNAEYDSYADKVKNASGTTEQMANIIEQSASGQFQILTNKLQNAAIVIGNKLIPKLLKMMDFFSGILDKFDNLNPKTQDWIIKILSLVAVIGPFLMLLGSMSELTGLAVKSIGKLSSAFGILISGQKAVTKVIDGVNVSTMETVSVFGISLGPILLIIIGIIGALLAAWMAWKDNFMGVQGAMKGAIDNLKQAWDKLYKSLDDALAPLGGTKKVFSEILPILGEIVKLFGLSVWMTWYIIIQGIATFLNVVNAQIDVFKEDISKAKDIIDLSIKKYNDFKEKVKEVIDTLIKKWNDFKNTVSNVWDETKRKTTEVVDFLRKKAIDANNALNSFFPKDFSNKELKKYRNNLLSIDKDMLDFILKPFKDAATEIPKEIGKWWKDSEPSLKKFAGDFFGGMAAAFVITNPIVIIATMGPKIAKSISDWWKDVSPKISKFFENMGQSFIDFTTKTVPNFFINDIPNFAKNVVKWMDSAKDSIITTLGDWKNALIDFFTNLFQQKTQENQEAAKAATRAGQTFFDAVKNKVNQDKISLLIEIAAAFDLIILLLPAFITVGFMGIGAKIIQYILIGINDAQWGLYNFLKIVGWVVLTTVGNWASSAWKAGYDFIQAIVNGIKAGASALGNIGYAALKALDLNNGGVIETMGYAQGGIVKAANGLVAGNTALTDTIPALLTPGEIVLNKDQQKALLRGGVGGKTVKINISINPGTMIASPGEQREFARKIKQLLREDEMRFA